eukprot:TRINITY_DN8245_c0_g1_i3.p1 TRINITY_DN8245_c0_g1~~TRINITY_DN8245_c0_g1_i3.p1  ORF type:complete len:312 (+),score=82.73 TRINITY_DN8245_c0_g1_i3:44-979(+)
MSDAQRMDIATTHEGCIHDVQIDFNGRLLATGGSDGMISIHEVKGEQVSSIAAHNGGVWQVAWAHHRAVGNVSTLASCGEDGRVVVWRDVGGKWEAAYTCPHVHEGGAVAISWAPFEHGCILTSGGADGMVSVIVKQSSGNWEYSSFVAHTGGVTGVSWAPFLSSGTLIQPQVQLQNLTSNKRFVTGGCDGQLRIWSFNNHAMKWETAAMLSEHSRNGVVAIRDVQWASNCGLPFDYIASCADDKCVLVWRQEMPDKAWKHRVAYDSDVTPCRLSWSLAGTILAVSFEDQTVKLLKEDTAGDWKVTSDVQQ